MYRFRKGYARVTTFDTSYLCTLPNLRMGQHSFDNFIHWYIYKCNFAGVICLNKIGLHILAIDAFTRIFDDYVDI